MANAKIKRILKDLARIEKKILMKTPTVNIRDNFNEIYNELYGWQKDTIAATHDYIESCLMAANRIGKTYLGTFIDAVHITGIYPDEWNGYRFTHAPTVWCLGYSSEKARDLLQAPIFGQKTGNSLAGGLVPTSRILGIKSMSGTAGAVRSVDVQHELGTSLLQFWSYTQGHHALMGDSIDWFHIDEEPVDQTIYPQVLTRTATGGNVVDKSRNQTEGGRGILTFTPENGRTQTVIQFMDTPTKKQFFIRKGWDDAPHLSDEVKESLLEAFPPHQRDMRTKGVPMLGHGRIYDFSEELITCDKVDIADHWKVIGGMDFGFDHPQAFVRLVIDPETDDVYLTHAWSAAKVSANDAWGACQKWIKDVPIAWPHDGLIHEKGRDDAKQQKDHYAEAGFNMLFDRATWDGTSNSVEQGLYELRLLMQKGKFKVLRGVRVFFEEFVQYHRDDKEKIVKVKDDVLDATRYAYMMRRYAKCIGELGLKPKKVVVPERVNHW